MNDELREQIDQLVEDIMVMCEVGGDWYGDCRDKFKQEKVDQIIALFELNKKDWHCPMCGRDLMASKPPQEKE